ncbi:MAG: nucleotidyltransferase family protein [Acidimicrobiales bacterium]
MTCDEPAAEAGRADATDVAVALWASLSVSQVAKALGAQGIDVMVLKGPPLQQRLLGRECAYRSADVDVLVPRHHARRARRTLDADGWRTRPGNGVLWRLDRAIALERKGVVVDLHWGVHLAALPPWTLGALERALWAGAVQAEAGWWEPRAEPLLVYLALHAAAFGFTKPAGLVLIGAAIDLVHDWDEVEALSRSIGAWPAVSHAVALAQGGAPAAQPPLLRGARNVALVTLMGLLRQRLVPEPARRALRLARDRRRR